MTTRGGQIAEARLLSPVSQRDCAGGLNSMVLHRMKDEAYSEAAAPSALTTFNEHRSLLFSIAYRMTGTVADAEDVLQDAFIRWQQAPRDDIRSPKALKASCAS
jgi:DNA-directed RNA polymerase specialized sigma24 family protein